MVAYETVNRRESWGPKGVMAFYLGPSLEHYRCARVYVPSTCRERVVNTMRFYPHLCAVPTVPPREQSHPGCAVPR